LRREREEKTAHPCGCIKETNSLGHPGRGTIPKKQNGDHIKPPKIPQTQSQTTPRATTGHKNKREELTKKNDEDNRRSPAAGKPIPKKEGGKKYKKKKGNIGRERATEGVLKKGTPMNHPPDALPSLKKILTPSLPKGLPPEKEGAAE